MVSEVPESFGPDLMSAAGLLTRQVRIVSSGIPIAINTDILSWCWQEPQGSKIIPESTHGQLDILQDRSTPDSQTGFTETEQRGLERAGCYRSRRRRQVFQGHTCNGVAHCLVIYHAYCSSMRKGFGGCPWIRFSRRLIPNIPQSGFRVK